MNDTLQDINVYWGTRKRELREAIQEIDDELGVNQNKMPLIDSMNGFENATDDTVYLRNSEALSFLKDELHYIELKISELHEKYTSEFDLYHMNENTGVLAYCAEKSVIPGDKIQGLTLPNDYHSIYWSFIDKRIHMLPVRLCHILYRYRYDLGRQIANLEKGITGESNVQKGLEIYKSKYKILQGIILPANDAGGKTSEIDTLIITDKGLVVTEVKNYGNENQIIQITQDGKWSLRDNRRNFLNDIKSPTAQNARHCLVLDRFLESLFGEDSGISVIPLTMIANDDVTINNSSQSDVIRVSEFYTFINKYQSSNKLSKDMMNRIADELEKASLPENRFQYTTYRKMVEKMVDFNDNKLVPFLNLMQNLHIRLIDLFVPALIDYSSELIKYKERCTQMEVEEQRKKDMRKALKIIVAIPLLFVLIIALRHIMLWYGFRAVLGIGVVAFIFYLLWVFRRLI